VHYHAKSQSRCPPHNLSLSWSSQPCMFQDSHPVMQSLLLVDNAMQYQVKTKLLWLLGICAGCFPEVRSCSTTPCTTIINASLHILTSQSMYWSCHVCALPQFTSPAFLPKMHPRAQPQLESLDSDSNHDTLLAYFNPTSNTLCINPSRGSLPLSILQRPASGGALTPEPPRATRNQPLVIKYRKQNIEYRMYNIDYSEVRRENIAYRIYKVSSWSWAFAYAAHTV